MITNNDKKIINEITTLKNLSPASVDGLIYAVNLYTQCQGLTLTELIAEAEADEIKEPRIKNRNIKTRLNKFIIYLKNKGLRNSTTRNVLARIKSIYNYYEIQLPRLQQITHKNTETYKDIPKKEDIQKVLKLCNIKLRALILFMASSGTARNETSKLKIKDFIQATSAYHNETDLIKTLQVLNKHEHIVPTWHMIRQKTHTNYYTFCTHEATRAIIEMLQERILSKEVNENSLLFELQPMTITVHFQHLNDRAGFGMKDTRRFFHAHSLRKFFSTALFGAGADVMDIDFMLGHQIEAVQAAYIKANPAKQKEKYLKYVEFLSFNTEYVIKEDNEELVELKERIKKLEEMLRVIE